MVIEKGQQTVIMSSILTGCSILPVLYQTKLSLLKLLPIRNDFKVLFRLPLGSF